MRPLGIDELEREVGSTAPRAQPLLARDRVDALHDPLLGQLGDGAHAVSLGPNPDARVGPDGRGQAVSRRALRRVEAGPLERLVAPPYDVHLARAARGVPRAQPVQRRPPDASRRRGAGRPRRSPDWREHGRARQGQEPGVLAPLTVLRRARTESPARATGFVASLRAEPYENGVVLPHERTHAGPKEGRLRLLRATRTQLEPIFLLHDGRSRSSRLRASPISQSGGDRLWRLDDASGLREHRAPDRGRPPPLRDRACVSRRRTARDPT